MKRFFVVPLLAISLAGCSTLNLGAFVQNLQDVEAQALAVVEKIRAGIAVANEQVDATIKTVCAAVPQLNVGIQNVMVTVANPGPKTVNAIKVARLGANSAAAACTSYAAAPPSASGRITVLKNLWAAYKAARDAIIAANAAEGA
jgi:hypothetical protein